MHSYCVLALLLGVDMEPISRQSYRAMSYPVVLFLEKVPGFKRSKVKMLRSDGSNRYEINIFCELLKIVLCCVYCLRSRAP